MSTEKSLERESLAGEGELSLISQGAQSLAELSVQIGMHFGRAEVRKRVGRYLRGLLAEVSRKNGWQMAEELGDPDAHGVQRLLAEADWDEEAVRDDLRAYVIELYWLLGSSVLKNQRFGCGPVTSIPSEILRTSYNPCVF